ncbi:hypothetical protein [Caulobacter sp. 17J80-11]|uniref:hypothetical protein n=1 Tax=Caulobacter sp. 17J80-11 TaxID=2763502 RepID=UPI001653A123|nr:hypothetical protein [Caulobacter sp. 17J80-11]MBC6982284.1 hypothetical protein [Caulobacter sp. 17J80-11]
MKPLEQVGVLWQVAAWRALIMIGALLPGLALSALIGQDDWLGGYITADLLLTLALRPLLSPLGPRAQTLHLALAVSWGCGLFFVAQLL